MCLHIRINQKAEIAKERIICFKCLTAKLLSPCYEQKYELGKMLTSKLSVEKTQYYDTVEKGLHAYANEFDAKHMAYNYTWFNQISGGMQKAPVVVKCEIPIGATYYKAKTIQTDRVTLEYASDKLIPLEIVEICQ
jgi:hypothetical protein